MKALFIVGFFVVLICVVGAIVISGALRDENLF